MLELRGHPTLSLTLPRSYCIDCVDQKIGKLIQLKPLPHGRLIEDVKGLCMKAGKICVKKRIGLYARWRRGTGQVFWSVIPSFPVPIFYLSSQMRIDLTHLLELGVYTADSFASIARAVSTTGWSGWGFTSMESVESGLPEEDSSSSEMATGADTGAAAEPVVAFSELDVAEWSFFSFNLASSPSTLFNKASNTSVLGPRFFGTASGQRKWAQDQFHLSFVLCGSRPGNHIFRLNIP